MLAIEMARRLRSLPPASLFGLVVMAVGGALDVIVHVASVGHHHHAELGPEQLAHLVGFAGMVLVLAGVVVHGIRLHRRPVRPA